MAPRLAKNPENNIMGRTIIGSMADATLTSLKQQPPISPKLFAERESKEKTNRCKMTIDALIFFIIFTLNH